MANTPAASKNPIDRLLARIDAWQQRHKAAAFSYGVIKKYGEDEAGYQGALLTYYGFLSLFPLLLVATSVIDLITRHNPELRHRLVESITGFFPIIGDGLHTNIHASGKTGVALVLGLLITLYGARGIANAVRHVLNHVWEVPRPSRSGFPKNLLQGFVLIGGAALGLLAAGILSSFSTAFGHSWNLHVLFGLASLVVLFGVFWFIFAVGSSAKRKLHDALPGAAVAAIGFGILQTVGGYLITHELKNLNGLYGQFALVLVLLFWLYLQAQVFLYAAEINTVHSLQLWPRSLTDKRLTPADKRAYQLYAEREAHRPATEQEIRVTFRSDQ